MARFNNVATHSSYLNLSRNYRFVDYGQYSQMEIYCLYRPVCLNKKRFRTTVTVMLCVFACLLQTDICVMFDQIIKWNSLLLELHEVKGIVPEGGSRMH